MTLEEKEHWATSRGGESLFMEKRLIARAVGSPRFALPQVNLFHFM
ncbi:MAG: hypothetical protein KKH02_08895 [Proteobacteria bacterium]|nr:hypothetical protein [Pseudomonadota bacterium]